jgi:hypothetical protein
MNSPKARHSLVIAAASFGERQGVSLLGRCHQGRRGVIFAARPSENVVYSIIHPVHVKISTMACFWLWAFPGNTLFHGSG